MSIQKYRAFIRVVELGSISKAAEDLGYTQSAVSRMVADLETSWGLSLLRRSRAGLSLSSDGIQLLPYIKELCKKYQDLQEKANALKGIETGFIRIGTFSSMSTQHLPAILKMFESRYPKIDFQLKNMDYVELEEALCAGEVDCGFICFPMSEQISSTFLMHDRMMAVLPPEHELADADSYPLQRLSSERFIKLSDDNNNEVSVVLNLFREILDSPLNIFCDVNDDYSIMAMVESGLGVSVLPELVTKRMPFNTVLKELDPPQHRDISIAVRRNARPSPATERFIQVVREYFSVIEQSSI